MEEQQKEGKVRFMSALLNLSFISTNAMWHLYNIFLSATIFSMYNKHDTPLFLENFVLEFNKVRFQVSKLWSIVENSIRISMNWSMHRSHITPVTFLQCYFFTFLTQMIQRSCLKIVRSFAKEMIMVLIMDIFAPA